MALTLMKGSEAIAEAAIRAGARFFFGYPITPQTEIREYMSARMPEIGGCFLQAESEVAAINMVYGAAGTGATCYHVFFQPRRVPEAGGHLLLRRRHGPRCYHQRDARRPRSGQHPGFPGRLFPGCQGRPATVTITC